MISDRTLTKLALKYNSFQKEAQDAPVVEQTPEAPSAQEVEESKSEDLAHLFDKVMIELKPLRDMKTNLEAVGAIYDTFAKVSGARDPARSIEIYLKANQRLQFIIAQTDLVKQACSKAINANNTIITYLKKVINNNNII